MFQTIIDLYDVFRTDVDIGEEFEDDDTAVDTDPAHYLSRDGFISDKQQNFGGQQWVSSMRFFRL